MIDIIYCVQHVAPTQARLKVMCGMLDTTAVKLFFENIASF